MSNNTTHGIAPLAVKELPRDNSQVLGGKLRSGLVYAFNYCRRTEGKMNLLVETLEFVLKAAKEGQKQIQKVKKEKLAAEKKAALEAAKAEKAAAKEETKVKKETK